MTTKQRFDRRIRVVLCICIGALLAPPLAWAGIQPQPFRTGLFGVTTGQAIRVSVLNAGGERGIITPCVNPGALVAAVLIHDLRGVPIFKSRTEPVLDGTGTFVDVIPVPDDGAPPPTGTRTPGGVPPPTPGRRLQVRAEVVVQPIPDDGSCLPVPNDGRCIPIPEDGRCLPEQRRNVHLTLEVFDIATGRTAFTLPFVEVGGIDPTPF